MEKQFTICATLIDAQRNNRPDIFFVLIDTIANRTYIYQLADELIDPSKDAKELIKELFNRDPDYQIRIKSDFLIRLVDELGGIDCRGRRIDGREALAEVHDHHFDEVADAIAKKMKTKNLLLIVPNLLNILSSTYETDLSLIEAIKTFIGEIRELDDWKIELIKVGKDNIVTYQKLL